MELANNRYYLDRREPRRRRLRLQLGGVAAGVLVGIAQLPLELANGAYQSWQHGWKHSYPGRMTALYYKPSLDRFTREQDTEAELLGGSLTRRFEMNVFRPLMPGAAGPYQMYDAADNFPWLVGLINRPLRATGISTIAPPTQIIPRPPTNLAGVFNYLNDLGGALARPIQAASYMIVQFVTGGLGIIVYTGEGIAYVTYSINQFYNTRKYDMIEAQNQIALIKQRNS